MRPNWFLYLYSFRNESRKSKTFAFRIWKKIVDNFHHTPWRHLGSLPPGFFFFTLVFFTMPLEKRISLDTKGAIIALRGEGLSLRAIGHTGNFKRRAEKNCAKGLGEDHSRLLGVTLRFNATPNASSGRCPRQTYKVLGVFQHVHVLF